MTAFADREQLWQAWPDGYLAMRGLMSLAGWQCLGVTGAESMWFPLLRKGSGPIIGLPGGGPPYEKRAFWREGMDTFRAAADLGDMLPAVSIHDTATWACILKDLADAADLTKPSTRIISGLPYSGVSWVRELNGIWYLSTWTNDIRDRDAGATRMHSFNIHTNDPAEAAVLARIQLRTMSSATPTLGSRQENYKES